MDLNWAAINWWAVLASVVAGRGLAVAEPERSENQKNRSRFNGQW